MKIKLLHKDGLEYITVKENDFILSTIKENQYKLYNKKLKLKMILTIDHYSDNHKGTNDGHILVAWFYGNEQWKWQNKHDFYDNHKYNIDLADLSELFNFSKDMYNDFYSGIKKRLQHERINQNGNK